MDEFPWTHLITFLSMREVRCLLQTRRHTEDYYCAFRQEVANRLAAIQAQIRRVETRLQAARRPLADAREVQSRTRQRRQ